MNCQVGIHYKHINILETCSTDAAGWTKWKKNELQYILTHQKQKHCCRYRGVSISADNKLSAVKHRCSRRVIGEYKVISVWIWNVIFTYSAKDDCRWRQGIDGAGSQIAKHPKKKSPQSSKKKRNPQGQSRQPLRVPWGKKTSVGGRAVLPKLTLGAEQPYPSEVYAPVFDYRCLHHHLPFFSTAFIVFIPSSWNNLLVIGVDQFVPIDLSQFRQQHTAELGTFKDRSNFLECQECFAQSRTESQKLSQLQALQ